MSATLPKSTKIPKPRLDFAFFDRPVLDVARDLLGKRLVRMLNDRRLGGIILETEAYCGEEDLACHARAGQTARTAIMYGAAGHAYVYFTYGIHWMLNFVTGPVNFPAAVLLRAILPVEGLDIIALRRNGRKFEQWCDGPAKICEALQIDGKLNGHNLCSPNSELWIEEGVEFQEQRISRQIRIGIQNVPEPWRSKPWRFTVKVKT